MALGSISRAGSPQCSPSLTDVAPPRFNTCLPHSFQVICPRTVCRLAHRLVYRKIRRDLGIQDWVISGGGSLAQHLDDWFEVGAKGGAFLKQHLDDWFKVGEKRVSACLPQHRLDVWFKVGEQG